MGMSFLNIPENKSRFFERWGASVPHVLIPVVLIFGILLCTFLPFDVRTNKVLLAEWGILITVFWFVTKNVWLRTFLIWCVIRSICSYTELETEKHIYTTLHTIFAYMAFYGVLVRYMNDKLKNVIFSTIVFIGMINVCFILWQKFGMWIWFQPRSAHVTEASYFWGMVTFIKGHFSCNGLLDNSNITGSCLAICLPAFFRRKYYLGIPLILGALYVVGSMGGLVTGVVVTVVWLISKTNKKAIYSSILLILLSLAVLYNVDRIEKEANSRTVIWHKAVKHVVPHRVVEGYGLGQWKVIGKLFPSNLGNWGDIIRSLKSGKQYEVVWFNKLHNEYLQTWVELGGIGLALMLIYLVLAIKRGNSVQARYGVLAFMINAMVHFTVHTTVILIPICYLTMLEKEELWHDTYSQERKKISS